jgi:hypothetical protein
MPTADTTDEASASKGIEQAIKLLTDALGIVDAMGDLPEVGARIQGVIDDLRSALD